MYLFSVNEANTHDLDCALTRMIDLYSQRVYNSFDEVRTIHFIFSIIGVCLIIVLLVTLFTPMMSDLSAEGRLTSKVIMLVPINVAEKVQALSAYLNTGELEEGDNVQNQLAQVRQWSQAIMDAVTEIVILTNNKGNVISSNTAGHEILGLSPSEMLGKYVIDVIKLNEMTYENSSAIVSRVGSQSALTRRPSLDLRRGTSGRIVNEDMTFEDLARLYADVVDKNGKVTRTTVYVPI